MNKIILIGNLGRDPDMSYTTNGTAVTKFSLAVSRRAKANSNGERETDWFNIVAWQQLAETCNNYLKKGQKIYVEGRLEQRRYTDKEGVSRTAIEVIINDMEMLTPKNQQPGNSGSESYSGHPDDLGELDEHPF
jgi:single-strand DNA-binding protein